MDFRRHLQDELAARCEHNSRYSLRAFAQCLGIGSSDLSKLIRQKRRLTDVTLVRLATRLGLTPDEIEPYREALRQSPTRVSARAGATAAGDDYRQLSTDTFRLLGDWYHMAILELIKVRGFQPSEKWVARRLRISASEVNIAVQRLTRLGLLEITADGRWVCLEGSTTSVSNEYTDAAKKRLQRQILGKAAQALDDVPFADRDQSAILMAVNRKHLPAAKDMIRDFRRRLCALLEEGDDKEEVYYLTVSLFPVSMGTPGGGERS
jgi:uncharacterized protein (TIGR02147 family)